MVQVAGTLSPPRRGHGPHAKQIAAKKAAFADADLAFDISVVVFGSCARQELTEGATTTGRSSSTVRSPTTRRPSCAPCVTRSRGAAGVWLRVACRRSLVFVHTGSDTSAARMPRTVPFVLEGQSRSSGNERHVSSPATSRISASATAAMAFARRDLAEPVSERIYPDGDRGRELAWRVRLE
jgi:hypothetical protein